MRKRTPIFFFIVLLAGIVMGLVSNSQAQDDDKAHARIFDVWVGGGSFLGVELNEVTPETVQRLGLKEERGALITEVVPESPAAKAGLQKDDVIVRWNGTPVESSMQLQRYVRETPDGRTVKLEVMRNGSPTNINVILGKRSDYRKELKPRWSQESREALDKARDALKDNLGPIMVFSRRGRMGVSLQNLTPQLAEYFGLKDRSGTLISSVREDSPASHAGLKAGDIILAIDGEPMKDPGDVIGVVAKKDEGPMEVLILRDRQEMTLTVMLEKQERSRYFDAPRADAEFDQTWPDLKAFEIPDFDIAVPPFDVELPPSELHLLKPESTLKMKVIPRRATRIRMNSGVI